MSRAFVRESDMEQVGSDLPERPQSEHPNYITKDGHARLVARVDALRQRIAALDRAEDLEAKRELGSLRAELRHLEKRAQAAIPVDTAAQQGDRIRFGATVEMVDDDGHPHRFTIVGEDEADVGAGSISWISPLGRELLNKRVGDVVRWQRPAGDLNLEILSFRY